MELALEIASESVGSQHLQLTEQHEERQTVNEVMGRRYLGKLLHGIVVLIDQFTTDLIRILGRCLPQERSQVVVVRSLATALKVDEIRTALAIQHHIACLKVAIEESLRVISIRQVLGQQSEVCLKLQLVEVNLGSLQETVFKIVEVEEYRVAVESRLGITVVEIQPIGSYNLNLRQLTDGTTQQFLLLQRITATSLTTATNGIEQRHRT